MQIDIELFDFIDNKCRAFSSKTCYEVDVADVVYSYIKFEGNGFDWNKLHVLNDWNEGKNNDPFWDEEIDMHSAESFILGVCKEIKLLQQ